MKKSYHEHEGPKPGNSATAARGSKTLKNWNKTTDTETPVNSLYAQTNTFYNLKFCCTFNFSTNHRRF